MAAGAAADLGARLFLAFVSYFVQIKARYIYLIGATATILVRFGMISLGIEQSIFNLKFYTISSLSDYK